jgi:hypothetical protein
MRIERSRLDGNRALSGAALAVVTDAFGGRGSIAQYNRDILCAGGKRPDIAVMRRRAPGPWLGYRGKTRL